MKRRSFLAMLGLAPAAATVPAVAAAAPEVKAGSIRAKAIRIVDVDPGHVVVGETGEIRFRRPLTSTPTADLKLTFDGSVCAVTRSG